MHYSGKNPEIQCVDTTFPEGNLLTLTICAFPFPKFTNIQLQDYLLIQTTVLLMSPFNCIDIVIFSVRISSKYRT